METTIRTCTSESVSSLEPVNAAACDKVPGMAGGGGGGVGSLDEIITLNPKPQTA